MNIIELANKMKRYEVDLGTNPYLTIRYYISIGILEKPAIFKLGEKRICQFNDEHVLQLKIINYLKKQGMLLSEVKDKLEEMYVS